MPGQPPPAGFIESTLKLIALTKELAAKAKAAAAEKSMLETALASDSYMSTAEMIKLNATAKQNTADYHAGKYVTSVGEKIDTVKLPIGNILNKTVGGIMGGLIKGVTATTLVTAGAAGLATGGATAAVGGAGAATTAATGGAAAAAGGLAGAAKGFLSQAALMAVAAFVVSALVSRVVPALAEKIRNQMTEASAAVGELEQLAKLI